jgi:hypothetical protein
MAKVSISMSPGPDGSPGYSNISAEGEPREVEAMTEAVDKLMRKYPVLKPKPKPEEMSTKQKLTYAASQPH